MSLLAGRLRKARSLFPRTDLRRGIYQLRHLIMSESDVDQWLQQGITAVKSGNRAEGREWLMKVLAVDQRHETAWLWLSGAVTSPDEQRICLENVLAINPANRLAQKGLAKLGETAVAPEAPQSPASRTVIHRKRPAVSTAQALLYPERQEETWEWVDPTPNLKPDGVAEYQAEESYNDVWTRDVTICGYCAAELREDQTTCPNCQRNLIVKTFQYEKNSPNLVIFWVLLFAMSQLYLIQAIYDVVVERNLITALLDGLLMIVFLIIAVGAYWRQVWSYMAATLMFILVIVGSLLRFLVPINLAPLNLAIWDEVFTNVATPLVSGLGVFLRSFRLLTAVIGLVTAVFGVPSDFARIEQRQTARLGKRLKTGADYAIAARKLAQQDLWASAILHWQRAAALEPYRLPHQINLGRGYARLGFTQRAVDTLTAVRQRTTDPKMQADLENFIHTIQTTNTTS